MKWFCLVSITVFLSFFILPQVGAKEESGKLVSDSDILQHPEVMAFHKAVTDAYVIKANRLSVRCFESLVQDSENVILPCHSLHSALCEWVSTVSKKEQEELIQRFSFFAEKAPSLSKSKKQNLVEVIKYDPTEPLKGYQSIINRQVGHVPTQKPLDTLSNTFEIRQEEENSYWSNTFQISGEWQVAPVESLHGSQPFFSSYERCIKGKSVQYLTSYTGAKGILRVELGGKRNISAYILPLCPVGNNSFTQWQFVLIPYHSDEHLEPICRILKSHPGEGQSLKGRGHSRMGDAVEFSIPKLVMDSTFDLKEVLVSTFSDVDFKGMKSLRSHSSFFLSEDGMNYDDGKEKVSAEKKTDFVSMKIELGSFVFVVVDMKTGFYMLMGKVEFPETNSPMPDEPASYLTMNT